MLAWVPHARPPVLYLKEGSAASFNIKQLNKGTEVTPPVISVLQDMGKL